MCASAFFDCFFFFYPVCSTHSMTGKAHLVSSFFFSPLFFCCSFSILHRCLLVYFDSPWFRIFLFFFLLFFIFGLFYYLSLLFWFCSDRPHWLTPQNICASITSSSTEKKRREKVDQTRILAFYTRLQTRNQRKATNREVFFFLARA